MIKCSRCKNNIEDNYNFCPFCGKALNEIAKTYNTKKQKRAQLKIVLSLIDVVSDEKSLKTLQNMVKVLSD